MTSEYFGEQMANDDKGDSGPTNKKPGARPGTGADATSPDDAAAADGLNATLDEVVELLEREIQRLKASLETFRLSKHPQRAEIIRWHVRSLDERQDRLEELQQLIQAERGGKPH